MLKQLLTVIAVVSAAALFAGEGEAKPATPLELKLVSHRAYYPIDRGGRTAEEFAAHLKKGNLPYGPAVALMVELHNTGDKDIVAYGAPRPQFILKGTRAESVCEVAPTQFQAAPSRRYTVHAGQSVYLNVISFFNPEKDEPSVKDTVKRLSYSEGAALRCVNWTEPGEYTLSAVLALGIAPAPPGSLPFDSKRFAFDKVPDGMGVIKLESNTVKLTIRDGTEAEYWSDALTDADPEVRFVAAHTLTASLPFPESTRLKMVLRLQDSDARVRKAAARALQRPAGLKVDGPDKLAQDPAVLGLLAALKDSNAGVRAFAVTALATWGPDVGSVPAILPLLRDADPNARAAAAESLGDLIGDGPRQDAVIPGLISALHDNDQRIVNPVVMVLGKLKAAESVPELMLLLKSPNTAIRVAAVEALGNIGPAAHIAEDLLFAALASDETRAAAATALGKINADSKKLLPALVDAYKAESDGFGRVAIVRAMRVCGPAAVPTLQDASRNDKESAVRENAASTLAAIQK